MKLKERTIGIIGAKRAGKTYFTTEMIDYIGENCIVFNTINALKPTTTKNYTVELSNKDTFIKQATMIGMLIKESKKKSISVNLVHLTKEEIVEFSDVALSVAGTFKDKYIFVDEIAEYLSQLYKQSREMERLIRHGGNFGNTFIFNTQRPAYLNKNTFNLIDILIVFRINWSQDIKVVKEMLASGGLEESVINKQIKIITKLSVGKYAPYLLYMSKNSNEVTKA